jgi:LmbE family N-acetylglucosaminyl deacetylase
MRRSLALFLVFVAAAGLCSAQPWVPDPLEPVSAGGLEAVDRALARLSVHARLLVVGAHPDDEDNALLTWVARGLGGEAAYLSLSRGEGGQNLIGSELGVELGAIRTGELLAARRLDGSRQYFARAYDFGYTRSLEETLDRWPRQVLREDAIRVVRRFKPQVVVAVFPADERAGHGQHQASAVIATDAFELAGDGSAFAALPESPWAPSAFYRRAWSWRGEEGTHGYSLAALEPVSGRSLGQLAVASRSFHRSQDMGREQLAGPARGSLLWIAGGAGGAGDDPFAGIDTSLSAIAGSLPEGAARDEIAGLLDRVERTARAARGRLTPATVEEVVPALAEIVDLLGHVREVLAGLGPEAVAARELVAEKADVAGYGLAAAAGVVVEAVADRETVAAGGELAVEASVWPAGETAVGLEAIDCRVEPGWRAEPMPLDRDGEGTPAGEGEESVARRRFRVTVSAAAPATVPYYLRQPRNGDLYDWLAAPATVRGEPLGPPPLRVRFRLRIFDRPVTLEREVVHRYADQAFGERRLPVRAVPPLEVMLEPGLVLLPVGERTAAGAELAATVRSNLAEPVAGEVHLLGDRNLAELVASLRDGSGLGPREAFALSAVGSSKTVQLGAGPPASTGRYSATAVAELSDGRRFSQALRVISYPHIRPLAVPVAATSELSRFELSLPPLARVGYVRGASDRVPEVLAALGLPVELLGGDDLDRGELAGFDAIVIGSRAYEIDAALRRGNDRLLEYVRGGGLLLVQYQQYQFVAGGFAPWPLEILRPHGRVTDETAPVEPLLPQHPVFQRPNRLDDADWQGWVQERGLYFAGSWDERYRPLLAIADPGREAERGALLVAPVGEGTYIYTGLSFFRQLPAGVAGAVRLFVNLLALSDWAPGER